MPTSHCSQRQDLRRQTGSIVIRKSSRSRRGSPTGFDSSVYQLHNMFLVVVNKTDECSILPNTVERHAGFHIAIDSPGDRDVIHRFSIAVVQLEPIPC